MANPFERKQETADSDRRRIPLKIRHTRDRDEHMLSRHLTLQHPKIKGKMRRAQHEP